jgi:hypothetical protein
MVAGALRYFLVAVLVLFALASVYFAASAFWQPRGTLGITTDYDAQIRSVAPGSPAARAGISPGDHVVLAKTPYRMRRYLSGVSASPRIGEKISFVLARGGTERPMELVAVPYDLTTPERSVLLFECLASLAFIVVGAALLLLRPSVATWGFALYCLIILPTAPSPVLFPLQHGAFALLLIYDVLQIVGIVGLIVFALEFPRRLETPWRTTIRRSLPLVFVVLAAMIVYPDVMNQLLARGAESENRLLQVVLGLAFLLAVCIAWDTYRRVETGERERLRWVVLGLSIGLVATYVGNTLIYSSLLPIAAAAWILNLLASLNVLLPLAIAHAVIRNRVLDIDFVISRAILYGGFTAALIATLGIVDWMFARVLEGFRLSVVLNATISVCMALAFDAIRERAQRSIQGLLFRKRVAAQSRLEELGRRLRHAKSLGIVEGAVTRDAAAALELASAALFRHDGSARFGRTAAVGWTDADCAVIEQRDALVAALQKRDEPVRLSAIAWHRADLPGGARSPVVAVPLSRHSELQGIVLYGGHERGGDIDSDELKLLERLVDCAGVALAHIEAEALRASNADQRNAIAVLQAQIDELKRHSVP